MHHVPAQTLGIDPGNLQSGWALLDRERGVLGSGVMANAVLLEKIRALGDEQDVALAVEWITSMGMAVGQTVFDTCRFAGRVQEAFHAPEAVVFIPRVQVKLHLCSKRNAKDPNVRQALIDLFPASGDGAVPQIGTKRNPGPLYGVASHAWPALAVAVVASGYAARHAGAELGAGMQLTPLERIGALAF